MTDSTNLPTNPDELLAWAARTDHSRRVISLFLGISRSDVEDDVAALHGVTHGVNVEDIAGNKGSAHGGQFASGGALW